MAALDYAKAGVDREAADQLVEKIAGLTKPTLNKKVKTAIGGYASVYEIDKKRLIAASTDGVGTKLKLAFRLGKHDTVGIDLVAMSVNDLLCVGAEPLFFLDYFATGKLDRSVAESVLKGIVDGCKQAGCALVGGETAEMPDFYSAGEYDLGGFAVGMVEASKLLPAKTVKPGDALVGIGSSGCHSNGFSLLRKLIPEGSEGDQVAAELLTPTRIYCKAVLPLIKAKLVKGLAHITGSGFLNVPRIFEKVSYEITLPPHGERPKIYDWVAEKSELSLEELGRTFNMGIGMVVVVPTNKVAVVLKKIRSSGEKAWEIGRVVKRKSGGPSEVYLTDGGETVTIPY
jgi:phosphoribosylformylglycinamidine cyclo-ligase